jgi:hypothetical protein
LTTFTPYLREVILDPRHAANTTLDEHIWEDEDFEEEEDEVETEAARAIAALETVRKKQEEDAKWMRWAEIQYPDPRKAKAAVTTAGKAAVTASTEKLPLPKLKKPASSLKQKRSAPRPPTWSENNCSPPWLKNSAQERRLPSTEKRRPHSPADHIRGSFASNRGTVLATKRDAWRAKIQFG